MPPHAPLTVARGVHIFWLVLYVHALRCLFWLPSRCPPNSVHSRMYTVLPLVGSPFTVPDRFSPCDCEYRLVLPVPVVPTSNQYSVAPVPALQPKLTVAPPNGDPGGGFVSVALF